jgi:hypothetical protein
MNRSTFWLTLIVASAACITEAASASLPPTQSGYDLARAEVFADICVDRKTHDINGLRIFVRPPSAKPRVLAQYAEGGLLAPVAAQSRPIPGGLSIDVPGDVPEATFSGRVIGDHADFRSHGQGARPIRLTRRSNLRFAPFCNEPGS